MRWLGQLSSRMMPPQVHGLDVVNASTYPTYNVNSTMSVKEPIKPYNLDLSGRSRAATSNSAIGTAMDIATAQGASKGDLLRS